MGIETNQVHNHIIAVTVVQLRIALVATYGIDSKPLKFVPFTLKAESFTSLGAHGDGAYLHFL